MKDGRKRKPFPHEVAPGSRADQEGGRPSRDVRGNPVFSGGAQRPSCGQEKRFRARQPPQTGKRTSTVGRAFTATGILPETRKKPQRDGKVFRPAGVYNAEANVLRRVHCDRGLRHQSGPALAFSDCRHGRRAVVPLHLPDVLRPVLLLPAARSILPVCCPGRWDGLCTAESPPCSCSFRGRRKGLRRMRSSP